MIYKYYSLENYPVIVPDAALTESEEVVFKEDELESYSFTECTRFELPKDKWFAIDDGLIVRFPKDKEWEWRIRRAKELFEKVHLDSDPHQKLTLLNNVAYLCGFSLAALVERLKMHGNNNEDLMDTFKRIIKDDPLIKNKR